MVEESLTHLRSLPPGDVSHYDAAVEG